jgi:hypothetical protein
MKDAKQNKALREQIARGINHGLNDLEIYSTLGKKNESVYPAELIGVIRDLMQDRKDYFENRIGD